MSSNLRSDAAAAGNPTPNSTPVGELNPQIAVPQSSNSQKSGSDSSTGDNMFHILPIDESKKNPPGHNGGGHDLRSEFHVGPAMMPGPFMSSMGTQATAFEREQLNKDTHKAKKD